MQKEFVEDLISTIRDAKDIGYNMTLSRTMNETEYTKMLNSLNSVAILNDYAMKENESGGYIIIDDNANIIGNISKTGLFGKVYDVKVEFKGKRI